MSGNEQLEGTDLRDAVVVRVDPPYPVIVADGALERLPEVVREARVALVEDERVGGIYGARVASLLEAAGALVFRYVVPSGEDSKSLERFADLLERLAGDGFDRHAAVVSLGGGVTSDLAGFVAASFMRGIAFYAVPTSLLAMVDASVGGKTGVNLPQGKNLIGAFHQPRAVVIDVAVLATLPEREFWQGAVEAFKHGLIHDHAILERMTDDAFGPHATTDDLRELVASSVRVKAEIVARDEHEHGERAFLNYGHTLAHALEAHSSHGIPHGDAVMHGLLFAAHLGRNRGLADVTGVTTAFHRKVSPVPVNATLEALEPFLARDKKNRAGVRRWVLLREPGRPVVVEDVTRGELERAWNDFSIVAGAPEATR